METLGGKKIKMGVGSTGGGGDEWGNSLLDWHGCLLLERERERDYSIALVTWIEISTGIK